MKATITNTSRAPQGVYSTTGLVFIEPGASRPVDVADTYVERLKALPFLSLNGNTAAVVSQPADGRDANGDTPEMAELRSRFDAAWLAQTDDLAAAKDDAAALRDRVAELERENADLVRRIPPAVVFEAKHRGAGSYSILQGDVEVRDRLTKEQAEAFNSLDAEGRAKWLNDNPKVST